MYTYSLGDSLCPSGEVMIGEELHDRRVRSDSHPHGLREAPYNSKKYLLQWFHQGCGRKLKWTDPRWYAMQGLVDPRS